MAEPSKKSDALTELFEMMEGRTTAIRANICIRPPIGCGGPATEFDDPLSIKEYSISGLCQKCQNEVFGG